MNRKEVDCKFFLPYSKVCCAPSEYESPPAPAISCVHPKVYSKKEEMMCRKNRRS